MRAVGARTWIFRAAVPLEVIALALALRWSLQTTYRTPAPLGAVPPATSGGVVARGATQRSAPLVPSPLRPSPTAPLRLRLPDLAVDARIVPVTVDARGALGVPTDVRQVGWWRDGARPGALEGTVVIDGHVDSASQGRGTLYSLGRARPGSEVTLTTTAAELRYRVVARRAYRKSDLPTETFARTGRPRLVLITCGGAFFSATHHYADNVVIYALPVSG